MRAHVIEGGKVVNTIEVESLDFMPNLIDASLGGTIGDLWDGRQFVTPVVTPTVQEYTEAVQTHLDDAAKTKNYDDIVSACSYAGAPNPFQAEGQAFLTWRADCWNKCYSIQADVANGLRTAPTIDALIAELPALVLP